MSGVRKHFCTVVRRGAGGCSRPRKYGISGCIPAVVSSVDRSSARGTRGVDGRYECPFDSKKARKPARSSPELCILGLYERGSADPGPGVDERSWTCPSPASAPFDRTSMPQRARFRSDCGTIVTLLRRRPGPVRSPRGSDPDRRNAHRSARKIVGSSTHMLSAERPSTRSPLRLRSPHGSSPTTGG